MKTTEMWGVRFGHTLVLMGCKSEQEALDRLRPLADDLNEYAAMVMEAEDAFKPYVYLMFHSKGDAEAFFSKHKGEELYKKSQDTAHQRASLRAQRVAGEQAGGGVRG